MKWELSEKFDTKKYFSYKICWELLYLEEEKEMKRKTKNIIIITLIIILEITSGFTIKIAKDSVGINSKNIWQNMET